MWEKLIELTIGKWLELQTPQRKTARLLVTLLSILRNCQEAYLHYSQEQTKESLDEWKDQVEALVLSHSALHDALDVFSPEIHDLIDRFGKDENTLVLEGGKNQKRNLRKLIEENSMLVDPDEQIADFNRACEKLREFIQQNYEPEDVIYF